MKTQSKVIHPWAWILSAGLLSAALYSPHVLQWLTTASTLKASQSTQSAPYLVQIENRASLDPRPAYFSQSPEPVSAQKRSPKELKQSVLEPSEVNANESMDAALAVEKTVLLPEKSEIKEPVLKTWTAPAQFNVSEKSDQSPMIAEGATIEKLSQAMVVVEYENEIVVEFSTPTFSQALMRKVLARLLLTPNAIDQNVLLQQARKDQAFTPKSQPYYFPKIQNQQGKPIRYPAQAYDYSRQLMQFHREEILDQGVLYSQITIPLHKAKFSVTDLAHFGLPYSDLVNKYTQRYQVDKNLVYAIMEAESAFDPKARSQSNALGLMQIKAQAAGRDVFELIDGIEKTPSEQELFDPETNIRLGTAYLNLLDATYFNQVVNPKSREMLVISAYNSGLNTVFKLFAKDRASAIEKINQLSPSQVYGQLRYQHPSAEARTYLEKVINLKKRLAV